MAPKKEVGQSNGMATRSQLKRKREEEAQKSSKRRKVENLYLELPSSGSAATIFTKTDKNVKEFGIIKKMNKTHAELKELVRKKIMDKREELWDQLEVSQESYQQNRNVLSRLHRDITNLKIRINQERGEEVIIEESQVTFQLINEE